MVPASGELWTGTFFTDRVVVEAQGAAGRVSGVKVVIGEVSHLFQMPAAGPRKLVGSCHQDVSCYPDYAEQALGVARIAFIQGGNTYVCSGALLRAAASGNFFLTANHCIHDQGMASTLEFFWLYQTSACGGPEPDLASVPSTSGGADLLATSPNTDFSLVKLRRAPLQAPGP